MTEADFLALLRTLPLHQGARGLRDDAAQLGEFVLTTDTVVEGVHYLAGDAASDVAWKLLAVNLSDLAAKGAAVEGALLNYPLRAPSPAKAGVQLGDGSGEGQRLAASISSTGPRPPPGKEREEGWDSAFLAGLDDALTHFGCALLGGDTVSLPANTPRVITLTAIGRAAAPPARSGARAGDALYVTGTIGDAGAGLRIALGEPGPVALLAAYRRPWPRLAEGRALAPYVHAMMDVSDGLLIDAARMAEASGLTLTIDLAAVPLSADYRAFAGDDRAARLAAATAGDDYQLLFAAPADLVLPVAATRIGAFGARAQAGAFAARHSGESGDDGFAFFEERSPLTLTESGAPVLLPETLGFTHRA